MSAKDGLRQTAKLFEGNPHKLPAQILPKYGEKPAIFCNCAAAYNAPGVATIVVAKRFPIPEESELIAIIPWSGETEMIIERGFLPENSPFAGLASNLEREKKEISVTNNIFRYSSVFPELTVIRLTRKGAKGLHNPYSSGTAIPQKQPEFDHNAIKHYLPKEAENLKKLLAHLSHSKI